MQPSFALASSGKETAITAVRIIAAAGLLSHLRFSSALGRSHRLSPRAKLCAVSAHGPLSSPRWHLRPARRASAPSGAPVHRLGSVRTATIGISAPPEASLCGKMRHAARRRGIWCSRGSISACLR